MSATIESSPSSQGSFRSKQKGGKKRGAIWDQFVEAETGAGKIIRCRDCNKDFKHPSNAWTLSSHWRTKHSDKEQPASRLSNLAKEFQPSRKGSKVWNAYADATAIPGYPVSMLANPTMLALFSAINSNIEFPQSYATVKNILLSKSSTVKESIEKFLRTLHFRPSITCDVWSDNSMKHSYLGITLHCIDKNLALVRVFLGLKELHGSHTAVFLRSQAEELLNKYKLNVRDIYKIVTDSGSNILCAFKDILLVESLSAEYDEEDEPESAITGRGEMDILEEDGSESSEELFIQTAFRFRIPCFAHCLQLVISNFFTEHIECHSGFKAMRSLISKFTKSSAMNELNSLTGRTLLAHSATRWASYITVIERFLEVNEEVAVIARGKKWVTPNSAEIEENGNGMATTLEKILSARFGWMLDVLDSRFDHWRSQVTGDYGSRDFNSSGNECTYRASLLLSWSCNKRTKK